MNSNRFLNALNNASSETSVSVTENGALGFKKTNHALTDFFFKVGSMRSWTDEQIVNEFMKVYAQEKIRALELLFFVRDCRGGQGEKHVFNAIFSWLAKTDPISTCALLHLIPQYGSWKTFFELMPYFLSASEEVADKARSILFAQWDSDVDNMEEGKSISLMGKWCPSVNTSSKKTRELAHQIRHILGLSEKDYRKTLASFREHLRVIETKMSAKQWSEIDYNAVPSRAGVIYRNAFLRNDETRRRAWLESLKKNDGTAKINTETLDITTIVQKYFNSSAWTWGALLRDEDPTLEAAWRDLVEKGRLNDSAPDMIPVIDGSGSMYSAPVGSSSLRAAHVALGLGLYLANVNKGAWRGKAIAFGTNPEFYDVPTNASLHDQLQYAIQFNDCGSTNIEAVFDLVLKAARDNNLKQNEIPQIVVFSDMEHNYALGGFEDERLFESIARRWKYDGYNLPKLFFWNVCSRTNTIPMTENSLGLGLVSGFSQSIVKMLLSGKTDPYEIICEQLDNERYNPVREAIIADWRA